MDALVQVHIIHKATDLMISGCKVRVFQQLDLLFLDRAGQAPGVAILFWLAHARHADLDAALLQHLHIGRSGVLDTLIAVEDGGCGNAQPTLQGHQGQAGIQQAAQVPAADGAGEHIHHDGQVDVALPKANVGDIAHPHLIRVTDRQPRHQVRVAPKAMPSVGYTHFSPSGRPQQASLAHNPPGAVPPDLICVGQAPQFLTDTARPIGRVLPSHLLDGHKQLAFNSLVAAIIVVAARRIHQITHHFHRIAKPLRQAVNERSFSRGGKPEYPNTFFATSNCMVSRPTTNSNSAICSASWLFSGRERSNNSAARARNSCFQRDRTVSLIPYSRLACARLFWLVSSSRTTRALNSGPFPGVYPTP